MISYYQKNKKRISRVAKAHYKKVRLSILAKNKKWREANPERKTLYCMRNRCNDKNNRNYKRYGALGVKCLIKNVQELIAAIGLKPKPHSLYSIDRIDPNGNYETGNIRWADHHTQRVNRRIK